MALSIGQSSTAVAQLATSITTGAVNTAANGSTFVVFVCQPNNTAAPTVSDNQAGNTYVQKRTVSYNSASASLWLFTCEHGIGKTGHTATVTNTSSTLEMFFVEIAGSGVYGALDVSADGGTGGNNTASQATPSITTTANGDVVISFFGATNTNLTTITDTYTNVLQKQLLGSTNGACGAVGGLVQSTAGSTSDTFTLSAAAFGNTMIAAWKPMSLAPQVSGPSPVTILVGNTATFTVSVTNFGTGLTYQWQYSSNGGTTYANCTLGTGITTASFTTAATNNAEAGNGYYYRCVVVDSDGTTNSDSGKLTVNNVATTAWLT